MTAVPEGAQPIAIGPEPLSLDIQLIDLNLALSAEHDYPDFNIAKVMTWIACGHHRGGEKPALMPVGEPVCFELPIPLDQDARARWLQIKTVARDLYDVRARLAAQVESLTEDLALLTVWAVADRSAPGVLAVTGGDYPVPVAS